MITVLNKPNEFPVQKTPIVIPPKKCACGHVMHEIPAGAKWNGDTGPCGGIFWDCTSGCRSTHFMQYDDVQQAMEAVLEAA